MAKGSSSCAGSKWVSYRRITVAVCCLNLIAALFFVHSLYSSFLNTPSSSSNYTPGKSVKYTEEQIRRVEESIRVRKAAEPVELVKLVKKLKGELIKKDKGWELSQQVKQEITNEILSRLKGLKADANNTEQRAAVELWRIEKLDEIKRTSSANLTSSSFIPSKEAKTLETALANDWFTLLEDIGFWMPADVKHTEINDKPVNAKEFEEEEEIIAGPPLPPECNAELHTDYDGAAVRWGLTHHKESAADCCQACLDHANRAKEGEKKCNVWVYCPSEFGCYSPDIYEHKHQECWLKQADKPRLNFKDKYSESYRNSHPRAPVVVPWMSGVVSAS